MNEMDELRLLLERVDLISWKYRQVLQGPEYRFNVFTILRREDDEVYLHSRFLAALLDPQGPHCQGDELLAAFLAQVGIQGFRTEGASVRQEYEEIDIVVTNEDQAVIIENKIYAQDQKRQLERYYERMWQEGYEEIFPVYLTLSGRSPSAYSLGGLLDRIGDDGVYVMSYRDDVRAWLDACIAITCRHPGLRETLIQYQRLVERLTGRSFAKGQIMEIKELLMDERSLELAVTMSEALVEAQIEVQLAFWEALERALRRVGFEPTEGKPYSDTYSRKKVRRYYETKSAGWHYGLMFKLAEYDETTDLVFFVNVRRYVHYGFRAYRGETCKIAKEAQFDELAEMLKEVDPLLERSSRSLGYTSVPRFAFDGFDTPTVFALADPDKRQAIVGEFAAEMVERMRRFTELCEERGLGVTVGEGF